MSKRKSLGVGSVSLILIFCALCLVIFALLTLSAARSENALAKKLAESTKNYYAADLAAADAFSSLEDEILAGKTPEKAGDFFVSYQDFDGKLAFSFLSPIDENRAIAVTAVYGDGGFSILRWRELAVSDWVANERLPVLFSDD